MSWTIRRDTDAHTSNEADCDRLREKLIEASKENILLFCSAPDIGTTNDHNSYYPFDCKQVTEMFRIGAMKADGSIAGMVGNGGRVDFILPGENVEIKEEHYTITDREHDSPQTGSSIATALAVGLAALIIQCVKLGAIYSVYGPESPGLSHNSLLAIKKHEAMKRTFNTIRGNSRLESPAPRLGVETYFEGPGKYLKGEWSAEDKWKKVARVARDLVEMRMEGS